MKKYESGYNIVGRFIAFLKNNPACKGNVHIKKIIKKLNAIDNKDLPLFYDLAEIGNDFGYTDNIEIIQTSDGVYIKTKQEKDDLDEIELSEEEVDKYIPYRNEIQDILEKEGLAENRTNSSGEEQLVQVSQAEEIFSAGCEYVLKLLKRNGELK